MRLLPALLLLLALVVEPLLAGPGLFASGTPAVTPAASLARTTLPTQAPDSAAASSDTGTPNAESCSAPCCRRCACATRECCLPAPGRPLPPTPLPRAVPSDLPSAPQPPATSEAPLSFLKWLPPGNPPETRLARFSPRPEAVPLFLSVCSLLI